MGAYEDALRKIWHGGRFRPDRTGTGTLSMFGLRMEFDLQEGFPLITTKKVSFKTIAEELLWFLSGDTNVRPLQDKGVHIWDEWADDNGDLGPVYGAQWRSWYDGDITCIDQIANVIDSIKNDPYSRRHIVSAWNVADLPDMALAPCHILFQFYVTNNGRLDCQLYQRSADMFLGVPYNIASYSLLTHMIAAQTGLQPGRFIWTGGDCHIYANHIPQVEVQITRKPLSVPSLLVRDGVKSIDDYTIDDFRVVNYKHHPALKGKVAV